jgi:hypothetical protein
VGFFVILLYLYENKNQKKMKKIVRLTESDLTRLVKRTINEMDEYKSEEYHNSLGNMMGHFYDNFNSMVHRYLDAAYELSIDIENDDSLSEDDKYESIDQLQEFYDDLAGLVEKYYQIRKKGRR